MKKLVLTLSFISVMSVGWTQTVDNDFVSDFPNYHPLVVHFPIILLLIAAVMQIGVLFFKNKAYNYTIIAFTVIGFITGLLAAKVFHAHAAESISPAQMEVFEAHEKFAYLTLWLSGVASAFKLSALFVRNKWMEIIALLLLIGSAITVSIAGHHGAELVYKYGIGPKGEKLETEH